MFNPTWLSIGLTISNTYYNWQPALVLAIYSKVCPHITSPDGEVWVHNLEVRWGWLWVGPTPNPHLIFCLISYGLFCSVHRRSIDTCDQIVLNIVDVMSVLITISVLYVTWWKETNFHPFFFLFLTRYVWLVYGIFILSFHAPIYFFSESSFSICYV